MRIEPRYSATVHAADERQEGGERFEALPARWKLPLALIVSIGCIGGTIVDRFHRGIGRDDSADRVSGAAGAVLLVYSGRIYGPT